MSDAGRIRAASDQAVDSSAGGESTSEVVRVSPRSDRSTILVVDDQPQNRRLVEGYLASTGHHVVQAADGPEALDLFEKLAPDLVLLDVLMPKMDGFEVCRRMRQLSGGADTPILYLTALSDLESFDGALDAGGDDYLSKPIERTALLLRVRSLLRVKQMNRELREQHALIREQHDALVQTAALKDRLSELIVHDLKNPLSIIQTTASYLGPELSDPDQRSAVEEILTTVAGMNRLVMNLLDVAKAEGGALVLRRSDAHVDQLVTEVLHRMRRRFEEKRLSVTRQLQSVDATVDVDLFERLLENLLDNCTKYAPVGSLIGVSVGACNDGRDLELRVSDQGRGIPDDMRERVFDKYMQVTTADAGAGVRMSRGLGLLFCRMVAEAHGGRIWNEANSPKGTVFAVRVPKRSSG